MSYACAMVRQSSLNANVRPGEWVVGEWMREGGREGDGGRV